MSEPGSRDPDPKAPRRYVIFHRPGPGWVPRRHVLEQPGVGEHFGYLAAACKAGKIDMAGPFLVDGGGGMIIMSSASTAVEAQRLVEEDPGIRSGLILAEICEWLITLTSVN
jgi:uncharacterized protein YciI